jgi:energy-coupling factor transporter ATP-binding protein EcfA2
MLELRNVSYRYAGATRASLREVSLQLHDGEVMGHVGASEAGKTTTCLVASGLAPRAVGGRMLGALLVDGVDVTNEPMHVLAGSIGIAFQSPATQLSGVAATVYEEVAFGAMNLGMPRTEVIARTESALDALRIASLAEREPSRLSGGQMQLVALAGLLAMGPRHLLLDEPTAQLDPVGTRLVADAIQRLAAAGTSILVAEQKTDLLGDLASRVVAIHAGRVALEGPAVEVLADPGLVELGVAAPAAVRLERLARERGLDPAPLLEAARS